MNVRSWAVGVFSTAAMVGGVVAVQSGVSGTAALPILPQRAAAPAAATGTELPVPAEDRSRISAPQGAATVQQARAVSAAVVPEQPPADPGPAAGRERPRARGEESGDERGNGDHHNDDARASSGEDSGNNSGQDSGTSSGPGPGYDSGHDTSHDSGHDSHGGDGQH